MSGPIGRNTLRHSGVRIAKAQIVRAIHATRTPPALMMMPAPFMSVTVIQFFLGRLP